MYDTSTGNPSSGVSGCFRGSWRTYGATGRSGWDADTGDLIFDSSRVVPTASENRPSSISLSMLIAY